jgi:glycosyltransferase involved in cell wall biosynthesis
MTTGDDLRVFHLVTAREVFFDQQIEILRQKGVDCTVCVVPGADQIDGDMGSRRGLKEYLQFWPRVRRELHRGEHDLVHANYGLTAPYAVSQSRLPVVLTLWGSDVVGMDGLVTKACAWRADAVTVRSEEMRELLGRKNAHIVPSGVDLDRFRSTDRTTARERVGWDPGGTHVLFPYAPGYERKNYSLAKHVVARAEQELGRAITLQTISGVAHHEMPDFYNASDCLLLTSKYEGSPNTVKEAMACNVPVVSTAVGDVQERLDGVSPGGVGSGIEQLSRLLVSVVESGERSNGREVVQELSWEQIGNRFLGIYRSVL